MTPVIFKMESGPHAKSVVAFFPTLPADRYGHELTCYAHIGQHSGASVEYFRKCKPAKPKEYAALLRELRSVGYDDLKIYRRKSRAMDRQRVKDARG